MQTKQMFDTLNVKKSCAAYRIGLWECPQFLFVVMGVVIIAAIIVTYQITYRFADPEVVVVIVSAITVFLLIIGKLVVSAFERVAHAALAKSEFISIMSHQLRSPLSGVKWQIDTLLSALKENPRLLPEGAEISLNTINDQNERMIHLVNDLLSVNQIEDNDFLLRPSRWSLDDLSQRTIAEHAAYAAANHVRITFLRPSEAIMIIADEERVKNVIEHLLDNAIRYSIHGEDVTISIERHGKEVVWSISDEGLGIIPEDQKRIFDKFFRASSVVRYQTTGSGLGLYLAKHIIALSGGKISFSSQPNKGSTFWFSLPG